jgi:hypothetical protein
MPVLTNAVAMAHFYPYQSLAEHVRRDMFASSPMRTAAPHTFTWCTRWHRHWLYLVHSIAPHWPHLVLNKPIHVGAQG